ncbi:uncharacterized protein LOC112686278 isoform X2 [Sipha flava]|nr:uncharacterized protein LOC112686278 isoform X2 [Sipha flava]
MPQKTLIKHLIRCPDRPPHFRNCVYNISHVMPESELKDHEENCPNRILFDSILYESEDIVRPTPVIKNVPTLEYEESWDGLEQTSDVLKNINKKTISMKAKHGSTKSERKKYRTNLHEQDINNYNQESEIKEKNLTQDIIKPLFIGKRPNVSKH